MSIFVHAETAGGVAFNDYVDRGRMKLLTLLDPMRKKFLEAAIMADPDSDSAHVVIWEEGDLPAGIPEEKFLMSMVEHARINRIVDDGTPPFEFPPHGPAAGSLLTVRRT